MELNQLASPHCAELLKALGEPLRLSIIDALRQGPKCVTDLAQELDTELVTVSHHLGILYNASLIQKQRRGRNIVYQLTPELYTPPRSAQSREYLNLGCCKLEIPKRADGRKRR
jgi:DNA-binding transcriptional ArsR family regulator